MLNFLFHFSAYAVLPFWAIMIFLPCRGKAISIIRSPWIILPPILCYVGILLPHLQEAMVIFYNPSPTLMAKIMSEPWAASLAWASAGAFDLFVGRWIYLDAHEHKISRWFVSPILFVCILFGPLGFFLYAIVKGIYFIGRKSKKSNNAV